MTNKRTKRPLLILTGAQKKHLRRLAHELESIVMIGNGGVNDNVYAEIDTQLEHHELIKIKVRTESRQLRKRVIDAIVVHTESILITSIGHIAVLYRPPYDKAVPNIALPE